MGSCVQNRPVSSSALKINELYTACNQSVWAEPQTARLKSCFRMGTAANAAGTPSVWNVNYTFIKSTCVHLEIPFLQYCMKSEAVKL